jgi:p-aminobenzoyl-glutamate transporter AbgT
MTKGGAVLDGTQNPNQSRNRRIFNVEVVAAVIAVIAFCAGVTKRWILEPIGDAFGDLSPGMKGIITLVVVVAVIAAIAFGRLRHRAVVDSARRVVEGHAEP